jgi:hypothetical protein
MESAGLEPGKGRPGFGEGFWIFFRVEAGWLWLPSRQWLVPVVFCLEVDCLEHRKKERPPATHQRCYATDEDRLGPVEWFLSGKFVFFVSRSLRNYWWFTPPGNRLARTKLEGGADFCGRRGGRVGRARGLGGVGSNRDDAFGRGASRRIGRGVLVICRV